MPSAQLNELLRLRGEVGVLRAQIKDMPQLQQENRGLASQVAAESGDTNVVSAEDRYILQQTHAVDATGFVVGRD